MRKSKNGLAYFMAFTLTMGMPTLTCADIEIVSPGVAVSGTTTTITDDLPASETAVEPTVDSASESEAEGSILGMDPDVNMYPFSDLNESMFPAQEEDFPNGLILFDAGFAQFQPQVQQFRHNAVRLRCLFLHDLPGEALHGNVLIRQPCLQLIDAPGIFQPRQFLCPLIGCLRKYRIHRYFV